MSVEFEAGVDGLLGQLESYANKGLGALENAKQEITKLEARNQQLTDRVAQLEASIEKLGSRLAESIENPVTADFLGRSDALMVMIKETLGVASPAVCTQDKTPTESELDKLNPQQRLAHWIKSYPRSFMPGQPQPLKVGIHEELQALEGGDMKKIRRALAGYVKVPRYLRCMRLGAVRLDLNGNNAGFVTKEEADFAAAHLQELEERKKQRATQKKKQQVEQQNRLTANRLQNKLSALMQLNTR